MHTLVPFTSYVRWSVLLLLLLAGCRTYGDSNTRDAMLDKIRQTTQRFAEDLERAKGERDALQRAAGTNAALAPLAERFATVVTMQEERVARHQAQAEQAQAGSNPLFAWVGPDSYRYLHRLYGAMITDQQLLEDRYHQIRSDLDRVLSGTMGATMVPEKGRYQIVPPFYERLRGQGGARSVADVLSKTRPVPSPVSVSPADSAATP